MADKSSSNSNVPGWVWLFTGAILGAFIMFLMRLSELQPAPAGGSTTTGPAATDKPETRFDFYRLLRDTEVPITSTPREEQPQTQEPVEYLLQVASFRSGADAEQLRAQLILLNFTTRIEQVQSADGSTWHRVIVGPFENRSQMARARSTLLSNRYEAMLLTRRKQG